MEELDKSGEEKIRLCQWFMTEAEKNREAWQNKPQLVKKSGFAKGWPHEGIHLWISQTHSTFSGMCWDHFVPVN